MEEKIKELVREIDFNNRLLKETNFSDEKLKIQYYINGLLYAKRIFEKEIKSYERSKGFK